MITTAKATQKELSQYIKLFQGVIEFSLDKMGLEVVVKHNKQDPDAMFDVINDKLIQVCDEYLKTNNLGVDKFGLATIVMQLYTQAAAECEEPYKVIVKETKNVLQGYLDKNKDKRETLNRVKKENADLDKQIELQTKENAKKKLRSEEIKQEGEKIEIKQVSVQEEEIKPTEVVDQAPVVEEKPKKTRKKKVNSVYETAVEFTF